MAAGIVAEDTVEDTAAAAGSVVEDTAGDIAAAAGSVVEYTVGGNGRTVVAARRIAAVSLAATLGRSSFAVLGHAVYTVYNFHNLTPEYISGMAVFSVEEARRRIETMQRGKRSIRVEGVGRIIELFIRGRPATSPVWRTDAMHFATYVDSLLYAEAESIDEYSDPATLEDRVCSALRSIGPQEAHAIDSVGRSGLNDLDFASKDADRVVDAICSIQISACTPALQTQYGLLNCVRRIQRCLSLHVDDARVVQAVFNATGILCFQHPANQRACDLRLINLGMRKHSRNRSVIISGLSALLDATSLPWEVDTGNDAVSDEVRV